MLARKSYGLEVVIVTIPNFESGFKIRITVKRYRKYLGTQKVQSCEIKQGFEFRFSKLFNTSNIDIFIIESR